MVDTAIRVAVIVAVERDDTVAVEVTSNVLVVIVDVNNDVVETYGVIMVEPTVNVEYTIALTLVMVEPINDDVCIIGTVNRFSTFSVVALIVLPRMVDT